MIWREDVQIVFVRGQSDSAGEARGFVYRRTAHNLPKAEAEEVDRLFRERYAALTGK